TLIARHRVPSRRHAADLHLQPLDGRIDEARRPARADLLAEDVPRLDRLSQFDGHAIVAHGAEAWETELDERIEPRGVEGVSELVQVRCDVTDVRGDEMRQKPTVVQCGTPTHQAASVRRLPDACDQ